MDILRGKVRKGSKVLRILGSEDPRRLELLVDIDLAYDYIENGYDPQDYLRMTVAESNFQKQREQGGRGKGH